MKRINLIFILIFAAMQVQAQKIDTEKIMKGLELSDPLSIKHQNEDIIDYYLYLTNKGWINRQDKNKPFTVYSCPNLNAAEIYSVIYKYFSNQSKANNDKISGTPNSLIIFQTKKDYLITSENINYDLAFNFSIDIKDGKVRFNYPEVTKCWMVMPIGKMEVGVRGFESAYTKEYAKLSPFNDYISMYISGIISNLKKAQKNNNW